MSLIDYAYIMLVIGGFLLIAFLIIVGLPVAIWSFIEEFILKK